MSISVPCFELNVIYFLQIRESSLEEMRTWVSHQEILKGCCRNDAKLKLDDADSKYASNFLLRFLRMNKFNIPKATSMLSSYIKMRWDYPHWYQGLGETHNVKFIELVSTKACILRRVVYSREKMKTHCTCINVLYKPMALD